MTRQTALKLLAGVFALAIMFAQTSENKQPQGLRESLDNAASKAEKRADESLAALLSLAKESGYRHGVLMAKLCDGLNDLHACRIIELETHREAEDYLRKYFPGKTENEKP